VLGDEPEESIENISAMIAMQIAIEEEDMDENSEEV